MDLWLIVVSPLAAFFLLPGVIKWGVARFTLAPFDRSEVRKLLEGSWWCTCLVAPLVSFGILSGNIALLDNFGSQNLQHTLEQDGSLQWNLFLWTPYLMVCLGFDLWLAGRWEVPEDKRERQYVMAWVWRSNLLWTLGFSGLIWLMLAVRFFDAFG